jgi:septal ring factor EnvC (AmiA/AmiB activator)
MLMTRYTPFTFLHIAFYTVSGSFSRRVSTWNYTRCWAFRAVFVGLCLTAIQRYVLHSAYILNHHSRTTTQTSKKPSKKQETPPRVSSKQDTQKQPQHHKKQKTPPRATREKSPRNSAQTTAQRSQQQRRAQPPTVEKLQRSSDAQRASTNVSQQQRKLQELQEQIARNRQQLQSAKEREGKVSEQLDRQRRKNREVQTSLAILSQQMRRTQDSILRTSGSIQALRQRLNTLRSEYRALVRRFARTMFLEAHPRLLLLSRTADNSRSIIPTPVSALELANAAIVRNIGTLAHERTTVITELVDSLSGRKNSLEILLNRHEVLKTSEEQRARRLGQAMEMSEKALDSIRANKKLLQQKLEERNASARKLQQVISELIAEELRRKAAKEQRTERTSKSAAKARSTEPEPTSTFHGKLAGKYGRHSLPWPTAQKTILHGYGQYTNPVTNTVINNPGISIATPYGSAVRAVADGKVSLVHWLPGYGSLVIIYHGEEFRTVYANLSSVSVKEGASVQVGDIIGKSGRSVDGEYAHFEVWHNRQKLNPALWLQ